MNILKKGFSIKFIAVIMSLLLITASCTRKSSSPDSEEPQDFKDTAWADTQDDNFPLLGIHQDGSRMGMHVGNDGMVDRAIFKTSADSPELQVWIGDDGLPYLAYIDGYFILYDNFTETTVDLGIIKPDGEAEILRELQVDFPVSPNEWSYRNITLSSQLSSTSSLPGDIKWSDAIRWTGHAISLATCAAEVAAALYTGGT
jgi:hypothetical protein